MAVRPRPAALALACLSWLVVFSGVGGAGQTLPLSSHECVDGEIGFCKFENVFLYQGQVYYVAEGGKATLPKLTLRYWTVGAGEKDLWLRPVVVAPDAAQTLPLPPREEWVRLDQPGQQAHLWSALQGFNYGHDIGEFLPSLHNTLCKHAGRCTYADRKGLHLFDVYSGSAGDVPHPVKAEALRCITDVPLDHIASEAVRSRVTYVKHLSAGVGNDCRARLFCGTPALDMTMGRGSIQPSQMRSYRARMGECLGFDPEARAAVKPQLKIVVVDRRYSSGRHMLNVYEVMQLLKKRYRGTARVEKHYMEDMSLQQQARLWNSAAVVLHVHGAALGNYPFLPVHAVTVHIVSRPAGLDHDNQFPRQLMRDLAGSSDVAFLPLNNTDWALARMQWETVWADPNWQRLTDAQKLGVIERGDCEQLAGVADYLPGHCAMFWLLKATDVVVKPELLADAMDRAVERVVAMAGQQRGGAPGQSAGPHR